MGTAYAYVTRGLPNPSDLASRPLAQVTQIYDRTGQTLLYEFYEERRINIPLKDVSETMLKATLAAEDVNFYQHTGFDVQGVVRALVNNVRAGAITGGFVGGGSTITQQLVKRTFLTDEQSYVRKLREIVLAVQVERLYPKEQILELYLNQVYYGNQAYGVEAAALSYFGKHAKDLNLAEASLLAGLVQLPSRYDPVQNPKAALARQSDVLDVMVRYELATQEEADAAREQASRFTYRMSETQIRSPHFAFFVKEQLQQRVNPEVLRNGLQVITTIDLEMQDRAQEIVRRRVDSIKWQQVNNGSLVAINPRTGEILAMVGSYDYYNQAIDGQVNVATALRQPGSSFKAFTYATAFASKRWSPASTVVDQPISRPDQTSRTGRYVPVNYDEKWHGTVTLRSALANSYNIPALLVQEAVGTKEVIGTARRMGVTTELPEVASLTLGAGVVRLLDMTSAYGVFANRGAAGGAQPLPQDHRQPGPGGLRAEGAQGRAGHRPRGGLPGGGRPGRPRRAAPHVRQRARPQRGPRRGGQDGHHQRLQGLLDDRLHPQPGHRGVGGEHGQLPHAQGGRLPGRGLRLEGVHGHHPAGAAEPALRRPARGGAGPHLRHRGAHLLRLQPGLRGGGGDLPDHGRQPAASRRHAPPPGPPRARRPPPAPPPSSPRLE